MLIIATSRMHMVLRRAQCALDCGLHEPNKAPGRRRAEGHRWRLFLLVKKYRAVD
jgi:hypothetical protein